MLIRRYTPADNQEIVTLFYNTVHSINKKDYTEPQLSVWAPEKINADQWCLPFINDYTIIAENNEKIVGFSNVTQNGYLDRFYVHMSYQNQGVATALLRDIENYANSISLSEITSDVSVTAKSFFENQGYIIVSKNIIKRSGQELINYTMKKNIE